MDKKLCFYDTETCGLHGIPVTIQYAFGDDEIKIHHIWKHQVVDTLLLIQKMMQNVTVGFNLAFDHFHLCKIYTIFDMLNKPEAWPEDHIEELAQIEPEARKGPCLKPFSALDLMLHARKTTFQSTMDRRDINIRRVPTPIAFELAGILEKKLNLDEIYFARRKDKYAPKWRIKDIKGTNDFKDIVLSFKASSSLKALALHALKHKDRILHFQDVEPQRFPIELGYAPFALAITKGPDWYGYILKGKKKKYGYAWPGLIKEHIDHWYYNKDAQEYACNDVKYTRELYHYFNCPDVGDDDSILACCVAAVRWKGYAIDLEKIAALRNKYAELMDKYPTAPRQASRWINESVGPAERAILENAGGSTKKTILEELANRLPEPCIACGEKGCDICDSKGKIVSESSIRAKHVLESRIAKKKVELYDKLLLAGRFHFSVIVIGTRSSRMSGTDGLNPQGIDHTKEVRSCFTIADPDTKLLLGDFAGFEVVLADATYNDPTLRKDLLTCDKCGGEMICENGPPKCIKCGSNDGKKIHALFGEAVFPKMTYNEIKASKGKELDFYDRSKRGLFSQLYGGNADTMARRIGINIEDAKQGELRWSRRYPGIAKAKNRIFDMFCSMRQPGGIGSRVEWHEPADSIKSLFGFERFFTLENKICKILFDLANKPPKHWKDLKIKVQRRAERIQTAGGASQSALYAAAFAIQAYNMRAAANHEIQCSGAQVTKRVQREVWEIQPHGVNKWIVQPCNVHDEILCPTNPNYVKTVTKTVYDTVETFRPKVPLIVMDWSESANTWADK